MITKHYFGSLTILARNQCAPGSHITTQPTLILSLLSPTLSCLLFFPRGYAYPRSGPVYQDRRTDYRDACQTNDVTKKVGRVGGESDWIWATVGRYEERKMVSLKESRGASVHRGPQLFFFCSFFYSLRPTDPNTSGLQPSTNRPFSDVAMSSELVHARADTAASRNTFATIKTLLALSILCRDLSTVCRLLFVSVLL